MATADGRWLSVDATLYLIHHVVLPPQLPQENDFDAHYDRCLLETIICALQALRESVKDCNAKSVVSTGITSIKNLHDSRDIHGNVSEYQLREVFQKLAFATTKELVPLEIKAQNAGLLVNNATMGSMGRLVRTFPGTASEIPAILMQDAAFRESLAYTIAKMTTQAAPGTQPHVRKNGVTIDEERDTTHPMLVTDWLMKYTAALGESTSAIRISKNTREEVLWSNCKHPWRHSPLWLLVRVTLQLLFTRQEETEQPLNGLYKAFVDQLLSQVLASFPAAIHHR
ncbi:hypothetical protein EKO04_006312 [Ascochyta lentis]|uniref:DUF6606 domain-containing protein n=1 Tax=Ascochyta lentis TaxID=205686 RepID=A0A8H7MHN2_9PLEO|nr:hypothetical protein EKO04_006312 [Ascochyta lentis]